MVLFVELFFWYVEVVDGFGKDVGDEVVEFLVDFVVFLWCFFWECMEKVFICDFFLVGKNGDEKNVKEVCKLVGDL